ncbi:hypothetical protein ACFFP0_21515 [Rhizobium puerariae]|uniref:Uncharacterized protein n=1 Tax=Rhizobium puerariae TaxID=1585791 RepID=A0ABV6ALD8_9HYPH
MARKFSEARVFGMVLNGFSGKAAKTAKPESAGGSGASQSVLLRCRIDAQMFCWIRNHGLFPAETFPDHWRSGVPGLMRWLFIAVLAILVGCILSIIWMNDDSNWPRSGNRVDGTQPSQQNPLVPPPPTNP